MSSETTFEVVSAMIREILGDDWDPDDTITPETSFNDGLQLESIEFVALAEKLQARYGDRVDFVTWLSAKELDELIAMRVGEVSDFIDQCLSSRPTA